MSEDNELRSSYKWLRERLSAEIPDAEHADCIYDCGHAYAVGVSKGDGENRRRHSVRVEYEYPTGDDPEGYGGKSWAHYSLNADPAKEERVAEIIRSFRAL